MWYLFTSSSFVIEANIEGLYFKSNSSHSPVLTMDPNTVFPTANTVNGAFFLTDDLDNADSSLKVEFGPIYPNNTVFLTFLPLIN
jgi:hypothetical protein